MRRLVVLAALVLAAPALAQSAGSFLTDNTLLTLTRHSGVKKPVVISDDYRRAICDVARLMDNGFEGPSVTLGYDDGEVSFDCTQGGEK